MNSYIWRLFMNTHKTNLVEELRWRGMLHDIMPGTEEQLSKEMTSGYIGFDPTSNSLHIGNLVQVILLKHLQLAGHKPVALVGGATGMIGDPSGKSAERNLLSEDMLRFNEKGVKAQLEKFLDFDCGENSAEIVNNYDWFQNMGFLEFMREVGKHISISYMLAKDSVQKRLESGISFTEFSYQLVQGYDYYWLNITKKCKLQMGGSDQWGNIVTGTELIRRKAGGEAFAITVQLITKADGSKFGKSEKGNIWLDPQKTSPYQFYQFWLNVTDEEALKYLKIFTFLDKTTIEGLAAKHAEAPHMRVLQKELAKDVTIMVHGEDEYMQALEATELLFGKATIEQMSNLTEKMLLAISEGLPSFTIDRNLFNSGIPVLDLLAERTGVFPSKGEARKMLQGGGISLNKQKVSLDLTVDQSHLLQGKYILLQKGKKDYYLVIAE